jgi:hypothetical protein
MLFLDLFWRGDKTQLFARYYSTYYFTEAIAHIHEDVKHMSKNSTYLSPERSYLCGLDVCQGNGLNLPKRYFKIHLQYFHNEDVGFTDEKDIMGC